MPALDATKKYYADDAFNSAFKSAMNNSVVVSATEPAKDGSVVLWLKTITGAAGELYFFNGRTGNDAAFVKVSTAA